MGRRLRIYRALATPIVSFFIAAPGTCPRPPPTRGVAPTSSAVSRPPAELRVAVVHDWLDTWRGGENALAEVLALYPHADLYALVDFLPDELRTRILGKHAHRQLPAAHARARRGTSARYCRLFPRAIESLDLSGYDLVISISHAVAKGVRTHAGAAARVLLSDADALRLGPAGDLSRLGAGAARREARPRQSILDRLQRWDAQAATRVDEFIAISGIHPRAHPPLLSPRGDVVYPPVDVDYFTPGPAQPSRRDLPDRVALGRRTSASTSSSRHFARCRSVG